MKLWEHAQSELWRIEHARPTRAGPRRRWRRRVEAMRAIMVAHWRKVERVKPPVGVVHVGAGVAFPVYLYTHHGGLGFNPGPTADEARARWAHRKHVRRTLLHPWRRA